MSGEIQKKKLKFSRNADGSLGAPKNVGYDEESLKKIEFLNNNIKRDETLYKKNIAKISKPQKQNNYSKVAIKQKAYKYKESIIKNVKLVDISFVKKYSNNLQKKHYFIFTSALTVIIVGLLIFNRPANNYQQEEVKSNTVVTSKIQTNVKPEFSMITPLGAGVDNLGGFARISSEGSPPVYAYVDKIGDIPIKVSQQELPDKFKQNRESELKELATQFNAKDPLGVGDFTAYVGQSVKGPQSVVFAKGNNLVLIASDNKIENTDWIKYLGDLKY